MSALPEHWRHMAEKPKGWLLGALFLTAFGLFGNVIIQIRPTDAISNAYEWLSAAGLPAPAWLQPKSADHTIRRACQILMLVGGIWLVAGLLHYFVPLSRLRKQIPSTTLSEEQSSRLKQLRRTFESLALQSKGLHHVLVERKSGASGESKDDLLPPVVSFNGPPGDPRKIIAFDNPPGDSHRPIELTEQERASAPPPIDDDGYIRDGRGRALAKWQPGIVRFGYTYGDGSVLSQFSNVAETAAQALLNIPDEGVARLPKSIRPLCRPRSSVQRRYVFGKVPEQTPPWMAETWQPVGAVFDDGVIVDSPEAGTGSDDLSATWALFLHRLGWEATSGPMFQATRYYWTGTTSVQFSEPGKVLSNQWIPKVSFDRFYSVLGKRSTSPTDICWASVWALDVLLKLL